MIGKTIGPYQVVAKLGAGGMGEVYRAKDTKLNRDVAIKVLPDAFATDPERLARFTREAQTLAALNHPNIAAIYGIEGDGSGLPPGETRPPIHAGSPPGKARPLSLVMELVEGEDLSVHIARAALPLAEALPIAKQIADALEAAHEQGIVHRDLKPANIKVRADGTVKVLDFGLAKAMDPGATSGGNAANSPTLTAQATAMGMIIGTAAYMAPEQAKGRSVDKRADIWAFGVVLFEMLTGRRAFEGDDITEVLASVLKSDPDWRGLPADLPSPIRRLLRRCLEKDPRARLSSIGDARLELYETEPAPVAVEGRTVEAQRSLAARLASWLAGIAIGAAAGIALWNTFGSNGRAVTGAITGPVRMSLAIPSSLHALGAGITVDGRTLIVVASPRKPDGTDEPRTRVYTRHLDEYDFKPIAGTDGAQSSALSTDGKWLAFLATISAESSQRRLSKVPIDGSSPSVALVDWDDDWDANFSWLADGDILVRSNGGTKFFRLPTNGNPAKPPVAFDTGSIKGTPTLGNVLPGDRGVFFSMESWGARGYQLDEWLLDQNTGKARRLFESAGNAAYTPTGHIVFSRGDVIMAAPFDLDKLAVTGDVAALPGSLRTTYAWNHGEFNVSANGTLVSVPGGRQGTDRSLVTVDATGRVTPVVAETRAYESNLRTSRDGRKMAVVIPNTKGTYETWVADLDHPGLRRVLMLPNADCAVPLWSPDGTRLAYQRTARDKDDGVYLQQLDGSGGPQVILKLETPEVRLGPSSWAPDDSGIIVNKSVGGKGDILFVPISASGEASQPRALRATPADERGARFSPDGKFVAFGSDESGRGEIYVASYGAGALGRAILVSRGGGIQAAWAGDSRRLFYSDTHDRVMSVTISLTPGLSASTPVAAYDLKKMLVSQSEWDIMPDGRLLAIQKGPGEDDITSFNVVLNWFDEVRARMTKQKGQ